MGPQRLTPGGQALVCPYNKVIAQGRVSKACSDQSHQCSIKAQEGKP